MIFLVAHFVENCPFPVSQIVNRCRSSYGFLDQDERDYQKGWVPANESGMLIDDRRKVVNMSGINIMYNLCTLKSCHVE